MELDEEFMVVPAAAGGPGAVAGALARKLAEVATRLQGHCFSVSVPFEDGREPYIQGMTGDDLVYLEAANIAGWLSWDAGPGDLLKRDQVETLHQLGWRDPLSFGTNYFREEPPNWEAIATIALATLSAVFGAREDLPVRVRFFPRGPGVGYPGPTRQ